MKLTRKQYNEEIEDFYIDDYPIDNSDAELMFKVFNLLPTDLQCDALKWGSSDTEFRGNSFEYIVKNQMGMTIKEYYDSVIFKNWQAADFAGHLPVNFKKLKKALNDK